MAAKFTNPILYLNAKFNMIYLYFYINVR